MNILDYVRLYANEYQQFSMRTINPEADNLVNGAMGLCGEAGEVADLVKKIRFQGHDLEANRGKLIEEIGDCAWYLALLCTVLDVPMETVLWQNVEKLRKRYTKGFSVEESVNRRDKG